MKDTEFKVGDLVYYPNISNKIVEIVGTSIIANDPFPFKVVVDDTVIFITEDGKFMANAPMPVIYHATQENYEWLSATFPNVAFEPPPKKKESIEIIGLMKEAGHKFILCKAKDHNSNQWETVVAFGVSSYCSPTGSSDYMHDSFGSSYFEFYPINSKGQKIIDFVDGEVVLESENDIS